MTPDQTRARILKAADGLFGTLGFDATTTIKRSDFGVGAYAPNVSDEVQIRITTEAAVAAPAAEAAAG